MIAAIGRSKALRLALVLTAFGACTLHVAANVEGTAHTLQRNRWGACVAAEGGRSEHVPRSAAPAGFLNVGYESLVTRGADPFPCHHWASHRYAGLLKFDIPRDAHRILRAVLKPVESIPLLPRSRIGGRAASECSFSVARAAEIWDAGVTSLGTRTLRTTPLFPGSFASDTLRIGPLSADETHPGIDVTSVAQEWQDGLSPNLGFVISPTARLTQDRAETCLHQVAFEVEVDFEDEE